MLFLFSHTERATNSTRQRQRAWERKWKAHLWLTEERALQPQQSCHRRRCRGVIPGRWRQIVRTILVFFSSFTICSLIRSNWGLHEDQFDTKYRVAAHTGSKSILGIELPLSQAAIRYLVSNCCWHEFNKNLTRRHNSLNGLKLKKLISRKCTQDYMFGQTLLLAWNFKKMVDNNSIPSSELLSTI